MVSAIYGRLRLRDYFFSLHQTCSARTLRPYEDKGVISDSGELSTLAARDGRGPGGGGAPKPRPEGFSAFEEYESMTEWERFADDTNE